MSCAPHARGNSGPRWDKRFTIKYTLVKASKEEGKAFSSTSMLLGGSKGKKIKYVPHLLLLHTKKPNTRLSRGIATVPKWHAMELSNENGKLGHDGRV